MPSHLAFRLFDFFEDYDPATAVPVQEPAPAAAEAPDEDDED